MATEQNAKDAVTAMARPVMLALAEQDGLDTEVRIMRVMTTLDYEDVIPAIQAAARAYLDTPEGRQVWEDTCHHFNYGNFALNVGREFCVPFGFWIEDDELPVLMDDYGTQLASIPDEAPEEAVYEVTLPRDTRVHLALWFSDEIPETENCDACIRYAAYSIHDRIEVRSGKLDYDFQEKGYGDIHGALSDVLDAAFDSMEPVRLQATGLDRKELGKG